MAGNVIIKYLEEAPSEDPYRITSKAALGFKEHYGAVTIGERDLSEILEFNPSVMDSFHDALAELNEDPQIEYAELNNTFHLESTVPPTILANLRARANVEAGERVAIAGFSNKHLFLRGMGPSLSELGASTPLADPRISLYSGNELIVSHDDWQDLRPAEVGSLHRENLAPADDRESALML